MGEPTHNCWDELITLGNKQTFCAVCVGPFLGPLRTVLGDDEREFPCNDDNPAPSFIGDDEDK